MKLSDGARDLYEELCELAVIDAHEHLPSEAEYLSYGYCGPNLFAGGYVWHDLESAGMSSAFKATLRDGGHRPVDTWWPQIRPYWQHVQHTSYSRALRITARDLYGLDEISDATVGALAERVEADNAPGLYRRVLQERCGIRLSITCVDQAGFPDDPGLCGLSTWMMGALNPSWDRAKLDALAARSGVEVHSLEDAGAAAQALLRQDLERGAVGFKIRVADFGVPDLRQAEAEFRRAAGSRSILSASVLEARAPLAAGSRSILSASVLEARAPLAAGSSESDGTFRSLRDYLFDRCLDVAAEADVPVAVHTGYWDDFRELDPKFLLGIAARRRDVRFDLFHLGMPMVRDALLIGKSYPNVTLNLTWCPVISQVQTCRALDELLDLVPLNKVIAFGGDYRVAVQKVWGHLVMARECVAVALAKRVQDGDLDRAEAMRIARMWFDDNPARIYRIEGEPAA
ncbi:MAG: amidohydrolase family protein [Anaerolineae bacterium]|nr:amidohydrolase family protein [Anaerolineae bacterium]